MKWTNKFKKINGKPTKNTYTQNSLEPDENGYNLNREYVSQEEKTNVGEEYSQNEGDYNLGEAYVNSASPNPISSVVWEREEFDPKEVKESVSDIFISRKFQGLNKPGCFAIIAFLTLCSTFLSFSWPSASFLNQFSGPIVIIIAAVIISLSLYSYLSRSIAYKIIFCLTAKKNVFIVVEESETKKMLSQVIRYNYFISTFHNNYSINRALVLAVNDTDYKHLSFEGFFENNIANLKQPISFFDNYCAKYEAERCSPTIEKIIGLFESSNVQRENHLW